MPKHAQGQLRYRGLGARAVAVMCTIVMTGVMALAGASAQASEPSAVALEAIQLAQAQNCTYEDRPVYTPMVSTFMLTGSETLGPDKENLACDILENRLLNQGEQRCANSYGREDLFRNVAFVAPSITRGDCNCNSSSRDTRCTISVEAACTYESVSIQSVQICN